MNLDVINSYIKSAPEQYHFIASAIILYGLSRLIMMFNGYIAKKTKSNSIRSYIIYITDFNQKNFVNNCIIIASFVFITIIFFGKFSSPMYTMCDVFFPVYIFLYYFIRKFIISLQNETANP